MSLLQFITEPGLKGFRKLIEAPDRAVIAFDFDGVLSPIVDDPATAQPHPGVVSSLRRLGPRVGAVAIITGRPVSFILSREGMAELATLPNLTVFGQYGRERWTPAGAGIQAGSPRDVLVDVARMEIAELLAHPGMDPALLLEDKESAVAVHTRRARNPEHEFEALRAPLESLARRLGLHLELGKMVIELRPPGIDKGDVLLGFAKELDASCVSYAGDDLGDLSAFDAVDALRAVDVPGLKICSGSPEAAVVAEGADLVVDGPPGIARLLRTWELALHSNPRHAPHSNP